MQLQVYYAVSMQVKNAVRMQVYHAYNLTRCLITMTYDKILRLQFRHDNAPRTPPTLPVSQVSIEKLLRYADRLRLQTSIAVRPVKARTRGTKSRAGSNARPVTTALISTTV